VSEAASSHLTVEALAKRHVVLDLLELLNGAGWSAMQHRVAVVNSREIRLHASVCAKSSVSRWRIAARGNCTYVLRLTRGSLQL